MTRLTQADYLIGRFGGVTATARALGIKQPSVVGGWKKRGRIPTHHHPAVLAAGHDLEPPICHIEFFQSLDGTQLSMKKTEAA